MAELTFDDRMSDADALMWTIEKDPLLRSTITTVATFDQPLDHKRFREVVERASRAVPRLRQRVQANPYSIAPPRWEVDPNFDLEFHLRFLRAPGDGTLREVLDIAEPIAMQGFDRARPLWELDIIEGLERDRSAMILKLHHSITDGVGGIELAMHLFDLEPGGTLRDDAPPAPEPPCETSSTASSTPWATRAGGPPASSGAAARSPPRRSPWPRSIPAAPPAVLWTPSARSGGSSRPSPRRSPTS
jgi:diacylglycerol O-acyltransferase / wax synthase